MFEELEKNLKINFKNKDLLKSAFIHRSYLNEHAEEKLPHNERLEFLGDSVLGFIVSEHLFNTYPDKPEGDLTNYRSSIVNARTLAEVAKDLSLGKYLLLSKGEEATGGRERQYLLANTFEAFLGALYLDLGIKPCSELLNAHLIPRLNSIISQKLYKDYKSAFQEKAQEKVNITPIYQVIEETGPDHDRTFKVGVFLGEEKAGEGAGKSKQLAEQEAARSALEKFS
ncbi:MAG TPA: ribonuclease III [Candidatus Saccharimonadales bacterium]|nr:ribonuclease III [Candidatus Saccharimonadales bacterium]